VLDSKKTDSIGSFRYDVPSRAGPGGGYSERYWSPRTIPILDEHGEVSFLLHRVEEVTELVMRERVEAERHTSGGANERPAPRLLIAEEDDDLRAYLADVCSKEWEVTRHVQVEDAIQRLLDDD
jgi:hypothetical protein